MVDEQLLLVGHFIVRRKAIQNRCMMPSSLLISCVHIGNRYFQINGNSAPAGRIVVLCGTIPAKGRSGASILPVSTKLNKLKVETDGIGRDGGVTSAVFLPTLRHGRSGTLALLARVPGEVQDVPQAWTGPTAACYQSQPEVKSV